MLKADKQVNDRYLSESEKGGECVIPPLVYYEIRRGLYATNATTKMNHFDLLCREFVVGEMNTAVWDKAAQLYALHRQQGKIIEDADIFIAAFCLVNGYILVTNNIKHFSSIDGLKLSNWKE
jgi:tRNA(fMet)-specific endonuclease VapC